MLLFMPFASRMGEILFGWVSDNTGVPPSPSEDLLWDDTPSTYWDGTSSEYWNA